MRLYHFPQSPFSRRVRLALAHKGLSAELRDARGDAAALEEAQRRSPAGTMPVLVDGDVVLEDSLAILAYLDALRPTPPLWPRDPAALAQALRLATLADRALDALVDLGTRLWPLRDDPSWPPVRDKALGRARAALELVSEAAADRVGRPLVGDAWGGADVVVLTAALWLDRLPSRAPTFAPAAQIVSLGVEPPPALAAWAASHRGRPDVVALDAV